MASQANSAVQCSAGSPSTGELTRAPAISCVRMSAQRRRARVRPVPRSKATREPREGRGRGVDQGEAGGGGGGFISFHFIKHFFMCLNSFVVGEDHGKEVGTGSEGRRKKDGVKRRFRGLTRLLPPRT